MRNASSVSFRRTWIFAVLAVMSAALMTLIAIGYMVIIVPFPYPDHTPEEVVSERIHMAISLKLDLAAGVAWLIAVFALVFVHVQSLIKKPGTPT